MKSLHSTVFLFIYNFFFSLRLKEINFYIFLAHNRDCDRLTVLNHVKAHYRRGEFNSDGSQDVSKHSSLQHREDDKSDTDSNKKTVCI